MPNVAGTISVGADTSQLEKDISRILNKKYSLNIESKNNFSLGQISREASDFEKSLKAAEARVLAFGATTGIIFAVRNALESVIKSAIDVEKSLADINVVLNASSGELSKFSNSLFEIAKNTGQSFSDVAEAAKEFSRQGLGIEQTLKRTQDAFILTRLSGLSFTDSVESITASLNSFQKEILNSSVVVNKLAAVDQSFAVSSRDLAEAIKRVGSTAEDAGISFDQLLGIVTAVQQTTARGGAVIGNALKSIFARISKTESIEQLKDLGVNINSNQNALEKLQAISQAITLNPQYANAIKEVAGGVYQLNIVSAALKDLSKQYNITTEAAKISANATNQAAAGNEKLNQTLSALVNASAQNIKNLSSIVGKDLFAPSIKALAGGFNELYDTLNNVDPQSFTGLGLKFGEGLIKGVGEYISGPGLTLIAAGLGKLTYNFLSFSKRAAEGFFNISSASKQLETLNQSISGILSTQPNLVAQITSGSVSLLQVQNTILKVMQQQSIEAEKQARISALITAQLGSKQTATQVVGKLPGGFSAKNAANGFIPAVPSQIERATEIKKAQSLGYDPGNVKALIGRNGERIVYNDNERLIDVGASLPAIIPPKSSSSSNKFLQDFVSKFGVNPYKADGFIPNFAKSYSNSLLSGKISLLGTGAFGRVFDLNRLYKGVPVGVKVFNESGVGINTTSPSGIAQELDILQKLNGLQDNKALFPLFNFPKGFGDPIRSGERGSFLKEIIQGKTASKQGIAGDLLSSLTNILDRDLSSYGISPDDLHGGNIIPNQEFVDYYRKLEKKGLIGEYAFKSLTNKKFSDALGRDFARKGGRLSLIDVGNFSDNNSRFNDYFNRKVRASDVDEDVDVLTQFLRARGFAANGFNPISSAISREMAAGVPANSVKIGIDSNLINPSNPLGFGVYNTKDEPLGLSQGVNRISSSGGNPKFFAGADGFIPNFAISRQSISFENSNSQTEDIIIKKQEDVIGEIEKFKREVRDTFGQQQAITNFARQLGVDYQLTDETVKKIKTTLNQSLDFYNRQKDALKAKNEELSKLGISKGVTQTFLAENPAEIISKKASSFKGSEVGVAKGTKTTYEEAKIAKSVSNFASDFKTSIEAAFSSVTQKERAVNRNFGATTAYSVVPPPGYLEEQQKAQDSLTKQKEVSDAILRALNNGRLGGEASTATPAFPPAGIFGYQPVKGALSGPELTYQHPELFKDNIAAFGALSNEAAAESKRKIDEAFKNAQAALLKRINDYEDALNRGDFATITQKTPLPPQTKFSLSNSSLNNFPQAQFKTTFGLVRGTDELGGISYSTPSAGIFSGGENYLTAKILKERINSSIAFDANRSSVLGRIGSKFEGPNSFLLGLAAESIAGGAKNLIGDDTLNKRRSGSLLDVPAKALSSATTGGILGSSIGGPQGAAIGAIAGAIIGSITSVYEAIKNWNDVLPDLRKNLENLSESSSKTVDGLNTFINSSQQLSDIFSGSISASPQQIKELKEKQASALSSVRIPEEQRNKIQSLIKSGDLSGLSDIVSSITKELKDKENQIQASIGIREFKQNYSSFVNNAGPLDEIFSLKNQTLNPQGKNQFDSILSELLNSKNAKGQSFQSLLTESDIKDLSSQKLQGKNFFDSLSKIASNNNFKDLADSFNQLSGLSNNTRKNALSLETNDRLQQIVENRKISDDLSRISQKSQQENRKFEDYITAEITRFQQNSSKAQFANKSSEIQSQYQFDLSQINSGARLKLEEPFTNELENNLNKLAQTLKDLSKETEIASDKLKSNLINDIIQLSLQSSESLAGETLSKINKNSKIPLSQKQDINSSVASVISNFREQALGVNSQEQLVKLISENQNINKAIQNRISSLGNEGSALERFSLESELEVRKKLIDNLIKLNDEYAISNEQLAAQTSLKRTSAKTNSDVDVALIKLQKVLAIGGQLNNFGQSFDISKNIFDLKQEANINSTAGNTSGTVRNLSNIASIYNAQGLKIPDTLKNDIIASLSESIQKQVKEGGLKLPEGESPISIAQKKFAVEFKDNSLLSQGKIKETPYVLKDVTSDLETQIQLYSNVKEQLNLINSIKLKTITLNDKILKQEIDGLKAQRELNFELKKAQAAQASSAFSKGNITGDQFRQYQAEARLAEKELNNGRLSGGSLRDSFFDQFKYNTRDLYDDLEQGAVEVGQSLKSGFKDAFKSFADGTKSAEDALADFGIGILKKLGDKAFDVAIGSIFNYLGSSVGSAFGYGKAKGGIVGYSTGGLVNSGGSGIKDDVPALLTKGEYVITKDATRRYGIDFLESINNKSALYDGNKSVIKTDKGSSVNAVFANAFNYDDPKKPKAGSFNIDSYLSSFALDDENNPQNKLRQTREETLFSYLRDAKSYEDYKKAQIDAFRTQKRRALQGAFVQAGISLAGLGISYGVSSYQAGKTANTISAVGGATGNTVVSQQYSAGVGYSSNGVSGGTKVLSSVDYAKFQANPSSYGFSSSTNFNYSNFNSISSSPYNYGVGYGRKNGGMIMGYAGGGQVKGFGGDTSSDNIPAMLMDGEYVMRKNAVMSYGKDFFDKLNAGKIKKLADGGYLGFESSTPITSNNNGYDKLSLLIEQMIKTNDDLKSYLKSNNQSLTQTDSGKKDNSVFNISINVNVEKNTSSTSVSSQNDKSNSNDRDNRKNDAEKARALSELITNQAKQVIIQEKRPGGLLYE